MWSGRSPFMVGSRRLKRHRDVVTATARSGRRRAGRTEQLQPGRLCGCGVRHGDVGLAAGESRPSGGQRDVQVVVVSDVLHAVADLRGIRAARPLAPVERARRSLPGEVAGPERAVRGVCEVAPVAVDVRQITAVDDSALSRSQIPPGLLRPVSPSTQLGVYHMMVTASFCGYWLMNFSISRSPQLAVVRQALCFPPLRSARTSWGNAPTRSVRDGATRSATSGPWDRLTMRRNRRSGSRSP